MDIKLEKGPGRKELNVSDLFWFTKSIKALPAIRPSVFPDHNSS